MKPFNLEEAIAGKSICTRKGLPTRILDTNLKGSRCPIVVAVLSDDREYVRCYAKDGKLFSTLETEDDLVMESKEHVGWINIYALRQTGERIYSTKEAALTYRSSEGYVDTIKITWEE